VIELWIAMPDNMILRMVKDYFRKECLKVDPWLVLWLALFALLSSGTWGKIEQPILDVGRELETTARLLKGEILYRDIGTYYGPFAYYANAIILYLFGCRLEVFYAIGLCLSLAVALLFYHLGTRLMDARWAALFIMYLLIYCAIGPHYFNFIVPYSYGAVYATVFYLLALVCFDQYIIKRGVKWLIAAAISCGLAILSKQEFGISILGAMLFGVSLFSLQRLWNRIFHSLLIISVAGIIVILPLYLISRQATWQNILYWLMPVSKSQVLVDSGILNLSFIKTYWNWLIAFKQFLFISLVVLLSILFGDRISKSKGLSASSRRRAIIVKIFISVSCSLMGLYLLIQWPHIFLIRDLSSAQALRDLSWSFPFIIWAMLLRCSRESRYGQGLLLWILLIFSVILNVRWFFDISFFYQIYAPSVVLLFFIFIYKLVERTGIQLWGYLLILILVGCIQQTFAGNIRYSGGLTGYNYAISTIHGTFYTKDAALGQAFNKALDFIRAADAKSVLVLPEGTLLNFMSGTHSKSRELSFMPGMLASSDDEKIFIRSMERNPPELIVYVDVPYHFLKNAYYRNYSSYNPHVHRWITEEHQLIFSIPISPAVLFWNEGMIKIYR
jgi:4-amino-4-deoxy-L-arabinose transferase-like glycosyltransferase